MAVITFNTHEFFKQLKAAGFSDEQAEVLVDLKKAISASHAELPTKDCMDLKFQQELSSIKTDLAVLKLMMAVLVAGILSIVLRTFL